MAESPYAPLYGVLVDEALDHGWYSVVTFVEGSSSLYTSGAFGVIGAGAHERVRVAGDHLIRAASEQHMSFSASEGTAPPAAGTTCFHALATSGRSVLVAPTHQLRRTDHPAFGLYVAMQDLVTEIRAVAGG